MENVRRVRAQQRARRGSVPVATVALVGYTNAGKSTLFNALTQAGVLRIAEDVRHARSDDAGGDAAVEAPGAVVRYRRIHPQPAAHLVTAFRATLEEVQRAALMLHVSDATSPVAPEQDGKWTKCSANSRWRTSRKCT